MRLLAFAWLVTKATSLTTYAQPPCACSETPTRDEVDACAATMCEGFWTTSQLTPAQVAALHKTQSDDFRTRFSGKRRLRGSLLVVPDDDEGVAAMASLELDWLMWWRGPCCRPSDDAGAQVHCCFGPPHDARPQPVSWVAARHTADPGGADPKGPSSTAT